MSEQTETVGRVVLGPPLPIELLEAQRRIKAAQTEVKVKPPAETIDAALAQLRATLEKTPRAANAVASTHEHEQAVAKLRSEWNAPRRHALRTELDEAPEWWTAFRRLQSKLGKGFTAALVGRRGPGKTQIGVELMKDATDRHWSAYYCTAMDYFCRIKDAFHPDRKETQTDAQKSFVKPRLLVIDELNVRSDSAWEDNMLADLIGKRYNALLDTVLISNETAEQFEKSMGPSVIDRLNETGGVIECLWKSFRE